MPNVTQSSQAVTVTTQIDWKLGASHCEDAWAKHGQKDFTWIEWRVANYFPWIWVNDKISPTWNKVTRCSLALAILGVIWSLPRLIIYGLMPNWQTSASQLAWLRLATLYQVVVEASRHIPVQTLPPTVQHRPAVVVFLQLTFWILRHFFLGVHGWPKQTSGAILCTATTRLHHWRAQVFGAGTFSPHHQPSINIGSNFNWTSTSHPTSPQPHQTAPYTTT